MENVNHCKINTIGIFGSIVANLPESLDMSLQMLQNKEGEIND